jgi:hypothetical protein
MTEGLQVKTVQIPKEEWTSYSERFHLIVFNELRLKTLDRIDYALVAEDAEGIPFGFCTVKEFDSESVYWQFGGGIPGVRNSIQAVKGYESFIEWTKERYKRITTLIENTNISYLKLAMHFGFRIIGCRTFKGIILVELLNEFNLEGA